MEIKNLINLNNSDELKLQLVSTTNTIKEKKLQFVEKNKEIRDIKDKLRFLEAKEQLSISQNKELKNQNQRDAQLVINLKENKEYQKEIVTYNKIIYDKDILQTSIEYEETNLRILFYVYKDLQYLAKASNDLDEKVE